MRLRDTLPSALVAVACAVGTLVFASRSEPHVEHPAQTEVTGALLDGLGPGDRIAGWNVARCKLTADQAVEVTMSRDGLEFVLTVVPLGTRPENPPFSTATHAIYYGHARPDGAQIPAGALRAIVAELTRRLERQ